MKRVKKRMAGGASHLLTWECASQMVWPLRRLRDAPRASLLCFEKCLVLLDMLQVQALLFGLSQPWPSVPYLWLRKTRWTTYFNADAFLLSEHGAPMGSTGGTRSLWGEMDGVVYQYCIPLGALPLLLAALYSAAPRALPLLARTGHTTQAIRWWHRFRGCMLLLGQYLVVPCGLAVLRLLHCRDDGQLDADPGVACGGLIHRAAVALLLPMYAWGVAAIVYLLAAVVQIRSYSTSLRTPPYGATSAVVCPWREITWALVPH